MNNKGFSYRALVLLAFFCIYFIWGTTYLAIIIGLEGFPPFVLASFRFLIAGVLLVGYSLFRGEGLPKLSSILKNAVLGLIVLAGGQGLLIWSEQYIASGYAAVLIATLPIWFVTLDRSHWKFYFSNPYILSGVSIGLVGIVILFQEKLTAPLPEDQIQQQLIASIAVIAGAIFWVIGTLYNRSKPAPGAMYSNLGWQLLCGAVICTVISFSMGEFDLMDWSKADFSAWSAVVYLAVAGSILAFVSYTWLLNEKPAAIVGTYAYINPMVAVFLGWLLADELISFQQIIGMVIILASAVVINISRGKITK